MGWKSPSGGGKGTSHAIACLPDTPPGKLGLLLYKNVAMIYSFPSVPGKTKLLLPDNALLFCSVFDGERLFILLSGFWATFSR